MNLHSRNLMYQTILRCTLKAYTNDPPHTEQVVKGGLHINVRKSSTAVKKAANHIEDDQRVPIMNLGNLTQHGAQSGFPTMLQIQKMMQFQIQQMVSQQMTTMFGAMQNGMQMQAGGPGMSGGALDMSSMSGERSRKSLTNGSLSADAPDTQGSITDGTDTQPDTQQTDAPDQPGFAPPTTAQAQVNAMAAAMAAAKGATAFKRPAAAAKAQTAAKTKTAAKAKTKPAAKAVAKTAAKAKAKAKASTTKGKKKKEVPGWTMQQRIKSYPNGCSKCAWKLPGCTLSCFVARGQI